MYVIALGDKLYAGPAGGPAVQWTDYEEDAEGIELVNTAYMIFDKLRLDGRAVDLLEVTVTDKISVNWSEPLHRANRKKSEVAA